MARSRKEIQEDREEVKVKMTALNEAAAKEKRDFTEDDQKDWDGYLNRIKTLGEEETRLDMLERMEAQVRGGDGPDNRQSDRRVPVEIAGDFKAQPRTYDPNFGFRNVKEQIFSIFDSCKTGKLDNRLIPLAAAGSDEQSTIANPYGGFLIAPGFSAQMLMVSSEDDPSAGLTMNIPMSSPTLRIPARTDKNHATSVTGGLTVSRRTETLAASTSRMEMEQVELNVHGLFGAAYVTRELSERSAISITALLQRAFQDEFRSKMLDEKLNGTGGGEFEGILNCPAKIEVAKEGGQAADTIVGANIVKMRARAWRYGRSIWLANHDTLAQLVGTHVAGTNSDTFLFNWARGIGEPDMLGGRPIYFTEYTQTLGDAGDLILWDPNEYLMGTMGGVRDEMSIHVRFLEHQETFKFWIENDGRCWWRSALTPKNSTATLSPIVTLAARA